MAKYVVLLFSLAILAGKALSDDCEPGFANDCFSSVTHDLNWMIFASGNVPINVTEAGVRKLCFGLDDALNCTSDVIDTDCSSSDGRDSFDAWLSALRATKNYVCGNHHTALTTLLEGVSCWNVEEFLLCCEEYLGIRRPADLLHKPIDTAECSTLFKVTNQCSNEAKVGSCREQPEVWDSVHGMISAFFAASPCASTHDASVSSAHSTRQDVTLLAFACVGALLTQWRPLLMNGA